MNDVAEAVTAFSGNMVIMTKGTVRDPDWERAEINLQTLQVYQIR